MKNDEQRYSKDFYTVEAVIIAIKDYRKIATITMREEGRYYVCSFSKCIVDPKRVVFEFNNYLIELMNSRGEETE